MRPVRSSPDLTDESTAIELANWNARQDRCVFPGEGQETAANGKTVFLSRVFVAATSGVFTEKIYRVCENA